MKEENRGHQHPPLIAATVCEAIHKEGNRLMQKDLVKEGQKMLRFKGSARWCCNKLKEFAVREGTTATEDLGTQGWDPSTVPSALATRIKSS
mmetsp:Transcript_29773/g.46719  ORF Transcript_29773/g.46719 Transcript_29773/m.46719 type:complete len:92 (+) Transcript_29773:468-743(+)